MTPDERHQRADDNQAGVLAALPRTRPQRASARRTAAREQSTPGPVGKPRPASKPSSAASKPKPAGKLSPAGKPKATAKQRTTGAAGKSETAGARAAGKQPSARSSNSAAARTGRPTATGKGAPKASVRAQRKARKPAEPQAPKQGYEPEEEVELGRTVNPPSGGELVESLADILGELASTGASAAGRLLKDALSVFRRS